MAGEQFSGPLSQTDNPIHVEDGTLPRAATPTPGPIGVAQPVPLTGNDSLRFSESRLAALVASGPEAIRKAAEILGTSRDLPDPGPFPSQFGPIPLKRGMISDNKNLIIYTDWQTTIYLAGDKLYSLRTTDFVRNIWR
jgi:hypothetical protein